MSGYLAANCPSFSAGFPVRAGFAQLRVRSEGAGEWLPLVPVALQGFVAGFRAFRAPLQPDGLAVLSRGRGEDKPTAR
jgi:hypothetical protein